MNQFLFLLMTKAKWWKNTIRSWKTKSNQTLPLLKQNYPTPKDLSRKKQKNIRKLQIINLPKSPPRISMKARFSTNWKIKRKAKSSIGPRMKFKRPMTYFLIVPLTRSLKPEVLNYSNKSTSKYNLKTINQPQTLELQIPL